MLGCEEMSEKYFLHCKEVISWAVVVSLLRLPAIFHIHLSLNRNTF